MDETSSADRLQREQAFHDDRFTDESRTSARKYYAITQASTDHFQRRLGALQPGDTALEYGCGVDDRGLDLARRGVAVDAIDISPVAIQQLDDRAAQAGVAELVTGAVMDAENLEYPDRRFDGVFGTGILHHLDLGRALPEIARVLKPGGFAVFVEPLGHNPIINLYRRLTPKMRTPDEHPLVRDDFAFAHDVFASVEVTYYHALSMLAVPLRTTRFFPGAVKRLDRLDRRIFAAVPVSRSLAWSCVIELGGPRSASTGRDQPSPS